MSGADIFSIWVVYCEPEGYSARRHEALHPGYPDGKPTNDVLIGDSLQAIRNQLPRGLTCIARHPRDVPEIVETWL